MKVLFMGTPEFSVPCLKELIERGHEVCGVVTQPDKPKGRGHKMMPSPVKEMALQNGIGVFQPSTLKNEIFKAELEKLNPQIIVVVAYGKILPKYILDFPKHGCINVHASLLPKYRGAGPIQWSIINGEKETGITTMYMAEGLDTGDMLLKKSTEISETENAGELHDRLSLMGAELLIETLKGIKDRTIEREPQNDSFSSYAPMLDKDTGKINWNLSAREILNLIRGTNPWPVSYTTYKGEIIKFYSAQTGTDGISGKPGEIVGLKNKMLEVLAGDERTILISEIQFKGGKRMSVESYLNGHEFDLNEVLV